MQGNILLSYFICAENLISFGGWDGMYCGDPGLIQLCDGSPAFSIFALRSWLNAELGGQSLPFWGFIWFSVGREVIDRMMGLFEWAGGSLCTWCW